MIRWWNPCGFDMIISHSPDAISRVRPSMPVGSSSTTSHAELGKFRVPGCQGLVKMCFPNTLKNLFTHICSEENLGGLRHWWNTTWKCRMQSWKIHSQPRFMSRVKRNWANVLSKKRSTKPGHLGFRYSWNFQHADFPGKCQLYVGFWAVYMHGSNSFLQERGCAPMRLLMKKTCHCLSLV